jgi:hypothetical protein
MLDPRRLLAAGARSTLGAARAIVAAAEARQDA